MVLHCGNINNYPVNGRTFMKTKTWAALFPLCALSIMFFVGQAEAANGTLKLTFKSKDPISLVESNLHYGFIYLHTSAKSAPMEKYFSKADYILGPSNYADGKYTVTVPEGSYYIRVLQRKVIAGATRPYGPPEEGDLTWFQTAPITITAGSTLDLGTKYASLFGAAPITITGTIKNAAGTPLAGRYVRAQTQPCYADGQNNNVNQCGPAKYMAQQATDADGRYKLELRDSGTYFLYTYASRDITLGCNGYCPPAIIGTGYPTYTDSPQPITVQVGDSITADIVTY